MSTARRATRRRLAIGATLLFLSFVLSSPARAQNPPASHIKPGVPDLDQRTATDPHFNGNNHCTPTAAANSLTWFDQEYGLDVVPDNFNSVDLIDTMAAFFNTNDPDGDGSQHTGSFTDDVVKGFRDYLNPFGPFNNSGLFWDVKFQGSTFNRGYTIGQVAATPSLNWIKNELATDEDVLLNVRWYTENSPGVLTPAGGAHTITLDGYTSGGANSDLLIRDPWYPEGIIERDTSFPNRLVYEYNTDPNTPNLRAEIIEAVSVSPKEFLFFDGLVLPDEYLVLPDPTCVNCFFHTDYIDNLSFGIDLPAVPLPLGDQDFGVIQMQDPLNERFLEIQFNADGLLQAQLFDGQQLLPVDPFVNLIYGFGPSDLSPDDHSQVELFINKDALGDFNVDSFFDIAYQIEFEGAPGFQGQLGQIPLPAQQASSDLDPLAPTLPDFDRDGLPDYPTDNPLPADAFEIPEILNEMIARQLTIDDLLGVLTGDFNFDGIVNAADYTVWRDSLGQTGLELPADANSDQLIDELDRLLWAANYGDFLEVVFSVPEPGSGVLLLAVLLCPRGRGKAARRNPLE